MATRKKATPSPAASPEALPLTLPAELTIYTVGELHPHWRDWLQRSAAGDAIAAVHAEAVDQVDGAGLQLLLALSNALEDGPDGRPGRLQLRAPSDALRAGCAAMGLGDWLRGHTAPGVAA